MAWFNADDKLHSHPKTRTAGLEAMGLWVVAGTYCTDYVTEGRIPEWFVASWPKGKTLAKRLVDAQLWEPTDDGWKFLSWTEYQRTKEQVEEDKAKARERMRRLRAQRKQDSFGPSSAKDGH